MAQLTFVLGRSGTGKSSSLRNMKKADGVGYITATGKPLPFKNDIPQFHAKNYSELAAAIKISKAPIVVIDDFNYFMSFEEFSKAGIKGYDKFTEMAVNVVNIIELITKKGTDQRFYILAHSEQNDEGLLKLKTTGKMVSDKFVPEGLTNQVVETAVIDGEFVFKVKTDGTGIKTPLGMFETDTIPNDLKELDKAIVNFYK
jgi:phage protein|nr:MAG TPA: AAA domain protein [Caudoviricetes sp.]